MRFAALAMVLAIMSGCASSGGVVVLTDEELSSVVRLSSKAVVKFGVKSWMEGKDEETVLKIKAEVVATAAIMRENVLPAFNGASTEDVLRGAVDKALMELAAKLSPTMLDTIKLAVDLAASRVELPTNPAEKLSPRALGAVRAFFEGVLAGLDESVAQGEKPGSSCSCSPCVCADCKCLEWTKQ